jgi:hypothetical protein
MTTPAERMGAVLAILPSHNSEGKKDLTGAFDPEAKALLRLASGVGVINRFHSLKPMGARRASVLEAMELMPSRCVDSVALFCHGWLDGVQAGFTRKNVGEFAAAIVRVTRGPAPVVALFCCSTGDDPEGDSLSAAGTGEGSFADKMRDALREAGATGCSVYAHTTAAHTTRNPYVIRFDGDALGGYPVVAPGQPLWSAWKRALQTTDLRLRAPWMSNSEIHAELMGPAAVA